MKLSLAKENTIRGKLFNVLLTLFIKPLIRLIWVKKTIDLENVPKVGACILAANHQSYLDFLAMSSVSPRKLTFLAADKFYTSRLCRPLMEYTGHIKVERENKDKGQVIELGLKVLEAGEILSIFPQGTRSRSNQIGKTFTGVAKFALAAKTKVIPLGIRGAYEIAPPNSKMPRLKKMLELHFGKPMEFKEYYDKEPNDQVYRDITNKIMIEIARLSDKEYTPEIIG